MTDGRFRLRGPCGALSKPEQEGQPTCQLPPFQHGGGGDPVRHRGDAPIFLLGTILEVDEERFDGDAIRKLYDSVDYPLVRKAS